MKQYHKIDGLYMRDETTKRLIPGVYRNPMVQYLKNNEWAFTEKIDGTNIRVIWDGYTVSFAGRTDRAIIPTKLLDALNKTFGGQQNQQMFQQKFGSNLVTLYGEGYGAGIQNGGAYRQDNAFILFDVQVGEVILDRKGVQDIAAYFGIDAVPIVLTGTVAQAQQFVRKHPVSTIGTAMMQGLVGRPVIEVFSRSGKRTIIKVKVRDYDQMDGYK